MDPQQAPGSLYLTFNTAPSSTLSGHSTTIEEQISLITSPPELRLRNAAPEPQNGANDCSSAAQSASQVIQQATQQASQSIADAQRSASQAIQQATQQASQAVQQAQQSATQAIAQFSNQASQSIAAASRSVTSALSSASAAVASAQSSADQAVSRASESMFSAQASAVTAESVLKAAVAAATGSAAAAGSSFLAAAAKATQGAQASISAIGAAATSQVAQASQAANVSQTVAITATEAALAIVGSIIASTMITILIYFLVIRHKKLVRRRSLDNRSQDYPDDPKFPSSDKSSPTLVSSRSSTRDGPNNSSTSETSSSVPDANSGENELRDSVVKTTTVKWNPAKPPKAPTLASWLTLQESVSPFGPINLPDVSTPVPTGGQTKSTPQSTYPTPRKTSKPPPRSNTIRSTTATIEPKINALKKQPSIASKVAVIAVRPTIAVIPPKVEPIRAQAERYRESNASIWTDQSVEDDPSPIPPHSPGPKAGGVRSQPLASLTRASGMRLPAPVNSVRNTAEWLASPSRFAAEEPERTTRTPPGFAASILPENFGGTIGKAR